MSGSSLPEPPVTERVRLELNGPVVTLRLARPEARNAMDIRLIEDLTALLNWSASISAARQGEVLGPEGRPLPRVVVIAGEGTAFCAGADIGWMRDSGAQDEAANLQDAERLDRLYSAIDTHPCLTVARVHGSAFGGGVGVVACCDVVLASENARFAFSEAKLGILPAVIAPFCIRRIGEGHARRLFMLAGRFDAREAMRIGLVDEVLPSVPPLDQRIDEICAEMLSTAPRAAAEAKQLVADVAMSQHAPAGLRSDNVALTARMRGGVEGQAGLSAFLARDKAPWVLSWPPAREDSTRLWTNEADEDGPAKADSTRWWNTGADQE